jgi:TrmH family RNA methyltransferase
VLAIGEVPAYSLDTLELPDRCRLVVLDGLQDPGNVGTILRTAAALGATATIALPGTVDIWNAKVIRSSMGAQFHHSALHATPADLARFFGERRVTLWAADMAGDRIDGTTAPDRLALGFGNEGAGLSSEVRAMARRIVSLPVSPAVESLNVAVAAGIILYELRV